MCNGFRILAVGGQYGMDHLPKGDAVVTDDTEITGDTDPLVLQPADGAQTAEVIRTEDAGRPVLFRKQFLQDPEAAFRIVEFTFAHVAFRNLDAQGGADFVVSRQAFPSDGAQLAGDKGDFPMAHDISVPDEKLHAGAVVGADTIAAVIHMVDDY